MIYRNLGYTGLKVSEIAFGSVGIGLPYADQPMPSKADAIHLLRKSLEEGINFYDTARMYGTSESIIGAAFAGKRDQVILSTKSVHFLNEDGTLPAENELRSTIRTSLEESLQALRTDYVDVFMLHQANEEILRSEVVQSIFSALRSEGLVRFIGASTYEPEESRMCIESGVWDVIQMPLNLLDQRHLQALNLAEQNGVGVIIRSVLFRGMLTGRPVSLHPDLEEVESHIAQLEQWNTGRYPDLLTLAVKYVLSYPAVSAALIGMDRMIHLTKALEVVRENELDEAVRGEVEARAFKNPDFLNLNQWIKKGWLKN